METANFSKDVIDVAVYMDRNRGVITPRNSFVVFKDSRGMTWYIEPVNKCCTVEAVMLVHSIKDEDVLFGGQLTRETLDASFVRVTVDDFCKFIASAFRVPQPHAPALQLFIDARVCLNSAPLGVGTIRDVIKQSPWGF